MEEDLVKLSYLTSMLKQETDCTICLQTLKDPITTKCRHNFCNACISRVMKGNRSTVCPLCNTPIYRRGITTNVKIQHILKKICPIIELINSDTPVEILSHYKGKVTPSLIDGATKMGSVDLADKCCKGVDISHPHSISATDKTVTSSDTSKLERLMSNDCDFGVTRAEEEPVSFHNYDSFCEVEHLSASQQVQKTHSKQLSVDIPVAANVKSPAKKVKEWLLKSSSRDCSSSEGDRNLLEVADSLAADEKNEVDNSKRVANASKNELLVNKSVGRRKVYKGIRKSKLVRKYHDDMLNKSRVSIEDEFDLSNEEKDIIQDSCPVEINDTFDKLVNSTKCKSSDNVFSPFDEKTENQNNSVGLFESLPMPDNVSKRKRTSKKMKLDTNGKLILGLNTEKCANKRSKNNKIGTEVENHAANDNNPGIVEEIEKEESVNDTMNKVCSSRSDVTMKEGNISLNFNKSITDDSDMSPPKSGKRRLDVNTRKWPHFDNSLKDFQESRKIILPMLDVSVGDPHRASKKQQSFSTSSLISLGKVSSNQPTDIENNFVRSSISEEVNSPETTIDAKNMAQVIFPGIQDSSFLPSFKRLSYPAKDKMPEVTVGNPTISKIETPLSNCKKKADIEGVKDKSFNLIHKKILSSPVEKYTDIPKIVTSEKVENKLVVKPRQLVPFLKLRRLSVKKGQGPRVKFLMRGSLKCFDSIKKMHDISTLTDSLTLPDMRSSLCLTSVGIQTELKEEVQLISNGHGLKVKSADAESFEHNSTCSSSSSFKLKKILANVKSDLKGSMKEQEYMTNDEICEVPETISITPGYVGESDLSDNESSCKKEGNLNVDVQVITDDKPQSDEDSDCIVEGSQKNNISMERSLIKAKPISLVASALTGRELAQVKKFAETFNLHFSPQFIGFENTSDMPCTTHIVTKEDACGKTFCTYKYLCGMVSGCWIVSLNWAIDSLVAKKILDEKPYEFLDASGKSKTYRELHGPKKLFKDFQLIYGEPFSMLTVQQLKDVIKLGGGNVYGPEAIPPETSRKCLAIADASVADSSSAFCKFLFLQNIAVISCEWVIECIEEYRILSISNYVLNVDFETDPLEICEKLLEMGYDKDLVTIED